MEEWEGGGKKPLIFRQTPMGRQTPEGLDWVHPTCSASRGENG